MGSLFDAKIRKVGTSLGLLIPSDVAKEDSLKNDDIVKVAIVKKDFALIKEMFGKAKEAKFKFEREHKDRVI